MKKTSLILLLSVAAVSIVNSHIFSATPAGAAPPAEADQPEMVVRLPPGEVAPAILPAGIHDAMLLSAWIGVYQHQEPVELGEGAPVSGRGLAQYVLEHAIPVVWDSQHVCGGGSCSVMSCVADQCRYANSPGGVGPIYMALSERGDRQSLISTLAHEIFHRTQPFGPVGDSRYEEYLAFQIGARVAQTAWPKFDGYHPLDPDQLNVWFRENNLEYYFHFPEYPAAVAARVYRVTGGSDPFSGIPPQAYETPLRR